MKATDSPNLPEALRLYLLVLAGMLLQVSVPGQTVTVLKDALLGEAGYSVYSWKLDQKLDGNYILDM